MNLIASPDFGAHVTPPGHPERIERAEVFDAVAEAWRARGGVVTAPVTAADEDLARVHTPAYLAQLAATAGQAVMLDPDTFTSPESYDTARLAAGAAIGAARHAWRAAEPALALVRPPGHHAESDRVMGFCLFNNVAIAARALQAAGAARIAIVDIDVHHGNGTQEIFYADPTVLYISSHQHPYYPGTGDASETGSGAGRGFTLNLPFPRGTRDAEVLDAYRQHAVPAIERFQPDVMLVSAGFDGHERDPLAQWRMTTVGYVDLVRLLDDTARRVCGRRIAFVTEGGYDLDALRDCLLGTMDALQ